jgi:hypothetical protein
MPHKYTNYHVTIVLVRNPLGLIKMIEREKEQIREEEIRERHSEVPSPNSMRSSPRSSHHVFARQYLDWALHDFVTLPKKQQDHCYPCLSFLSTSNPFASLLFSFLLRNNKFRQYLLSHSM